MSKPIQVGCRVLIIAARQYENQHLIGKSALVVEKLPPNVEVVYEGQKYASCDELGWIVKTDFMTTFTVSGFRSDGTYHKTRVTDDTLNFSDNCLIRIDGDVENESECDEISRVKETV